MKSFLLSITLLLIINFSGFSQSGYGWEWSATSGVADAFKTVRAVITDASGNVYATGTYRDTLILGTHLLTGTPPAYGHVFTAKYDKVGNLLWVTPYNNGAGGVAQTASTIAFDANGNVYIGGSDNGTVGGIGNGFVAKYDNNGNPLWKKTTSQNEVIAINVGPDGNPIIIDMNSGVRNIQKMDNSNGNILWTVTNTGDNIPIDSHDSYSNFLDAAGNVYYNLGASPLGGANKPETIAGQNFTNSGSTSFFVSLDNNGGKRWIDSTSNVQKGNITVTNNGKLYLVLSAGVSSGGIGGTNQPATTPASYYELDPLGRVTFKQFGAYPYSGYTGGKIIVKNDGLYTTTVLRGGYSTKAIFGDYGFASPAATTAAVAVIIKYDLITRNVIWANSFEVTGDALNAGGLSAFDATNDGKVVVGGYYGLTIKLGSTTKTAIPVTSNPYSKTDLYIAQFDGSKIPPPPITTWTGAANNQNYNDPLNWDNGVPNAIKAIFPAGAPNYPNNISAAALISKLEIAPGATISLPLAMSIPNGIVNNGAIEINEAGIFYGGFNSGQTKISGTGKVVLKNSSSNYYGFILLDNSLEINVTGTIVSFGGTITGSLILTKGIYVGNITLSNPDATITSTPTSYVNGSITRSVNASGIYYFPVGSDTRYSNLVLKLNSIVGPQTITANFTNNITGNAPNLTVSGQTVTQLLNGGFWTITPNVALTSGSYNVTLNETGFTNSVTDATRYVVLKRPNSSGAWAFFGNNGSSSQTATSVSATAGNITGFSDFAIGIANASVGNTLPVTYTFFNAAKYYKLVKLDWQTAHEENNNYYNVQQSTDQQDWKSIARINAGILTGINNYSAMDNNPVEGINYYRLQQVDKDGNTSFSTIRSVDMKMQSTSCIFPNPVVGQSLHITTPASGAVGFKIADVSGRIMQEGILTSLNSNIKLSFATNGTYHLLLSNGESIRFIKY